MLNGGVSHFVPKCPVLSPFVLFCPSWGPERGQQRTNGDKTGHFGTKWETPPLSIYPHLALLNFPSFLVFCRRLSFNFHFSYICVFLVLSCVFWSPSMFLSFNKTSLKTPIFGQVGGCNKFFSITCDLQTVKSYRSFGPIFGQNLVDIQKH